MSATDGAAERPGGAGVPTGAPAAFLRAVAAALERGGMGRDEAMARLAASEWPALLASGAAPAVGAAVDPDTAAAGILRGLRCEVCGHPLHWSAAPVTVACGDRTRRVRNVPHIAACSCGYAQRVIGEGWLRALGAYFGEHPDAIEADGAAPAVLAAYAGAIAGER